MTHRQEFKELSKLEPPSSSSASGVSSVAYVGREYQETLLVGVEVSESCAAVRGSSRKSGRGEHHRLVAADAGVGFHRVRVTALPFQAVRFHPHCRTMSAWLSTRLACARCST